MTLRRTLQRSLSTTTRGLSQFGSGGVAPSYDTDAQTYITAVETADGESLETGVKDAINAFVVGCKSDGIWTAIKASCILAGARTLTGALVPLVGTAPTNNNFVSGDYSRTAGLTGDGSTKYLDSNRASNADGQNDFSMGVWITSVGASTNHCVIGSGTSSATGSSHIILQKPPTVAQQRVLTRNRNSDGSGVLAQIVNMTLASGLYGTSRAASGSFSGRYAGTGATESLTSGAPDATTHHVFNRNGANLYSNAQLAFYSIGESLDLALLDSRVTTLITDIGTALA